MDGNCLVPAQGLEARLALVAQRFEEVGVEVLSEAQAFGRIALLLCPGACREVAVRQASQGFVWRAGAVFFLRQLPFLEQGLEVPFEHRREIVAGVELADVLDSAEVERHGYSAPAGISTAATRR